MGLQLEIRVLSVFLLLAFLYLNSSLSELKYNTNTSQSNENNWKNYTTSPTDPKPIIYTFFSPKLRKEGDRADDTSEHEKLLHVWKTLWKESGWEPRLLTMDDAKKHPDFKKYSDLLQNSDYNNLWDQSYDSLCFFRWLAMASHGSGGWMADYDTFPMGITVTTGLNLPNNGQFTSYNRHVPALLSGTAEEWERVSHLLFDQVAKEKKEPVDGVPQKRYSDMLAFRDLHDDDPDSVIFKIPMHVLDVYPYKVNTKDESNIVDCYVQFERNIWVAHLSHVATTLAIEENKLHITNQEDGANARDAFAWELFFLWKDECLPVFAEMLREVPVRDESNSAMEKIENMRPKIFTFFQRIETTKRDTGMTDSDDDSLLDLWVKAWNEAGFDAKIMDLSDAKQHPRYNEYSQLLKDVPMENNGGINRPYNEMCFYRWLAMASVVSTSPEEIVWMADYDVFPLTTLQHNNQEPLIKPNFGGAFTVYSINVPCLMSGSAPEWERMAFKILQNGIEHHDVESQMWTDMFALMDLGDTNSDVNHEIMPVYHSQNSVISASNVLLGRDWKVEDCTDVVIVPKDTVAVHFSHHAMKTGLGGSAERVGERPTIIRDFISMKKNVCGGLENVKP